MLIWEAADELAAAVSDEDLLQAAEGIIGACRAARRKDEKGTADIQWEHRTCDATIAMVLGGKRKNRLQREVEITGAVLNLEPVPQLMWMVPAGGCYKGFGGTSTWAFDLDKDKLPWNWELEPAPEGTEEYKRYCDSAKQAMAPPVGNGPGIMYERLERGEGATGETEGAKKRPRELNHVISVSEPSILLQCATAN